MIWYGLYAMGVIFILGMIKMEELTVLKKTQTAPRNSNNTLKTYDNW